MPEMYRRLKSQKTAEPWMSSPALPAAVGRAWTVGPSLSMRRTTQTTRAASCSSVRDPWGTCSLIDFPGKWVFSADSRIAFEIMLFKGSLIEQKGKLLLGPSACLSWFVLSALNIQLQFQLARPRLRVIRVPFSAGSSACIQGCDSWELCFCFSFYNEFLSLLVCLILSFWFICISDARQAGFTWGKCFHTVLWFLDWLFLPFSALPSVFLL